MGKRSVVLAFIEIPPSAHVGRATRRPADSPIRTLDVDTSVFLQYARHDAIHAELHSNLDMGCA
jgi:hypothetical protein